jgi:hypothetical protein
MIMSRIENGRLILTSDNTSRADLKEAYARGGYYAAESVVAENLHEIFDFIPPENIAALTDAPILADAGGVDWPDSGEGPIPSPDCRVFWFPSYAIRDPWQQLKNTGRVEFDEAM